MVCHNVTYLFFIFVLFVYVKGEPIKKIRKIEEVGIDSEKKLDSNFGKNDIILNNDITITKSKEINLNSTTSTLNLNGYKLNDKITSKSIEYDSSINIFASKLSITSEKLSQINSGSLITFFVSNEGTLDLSGNIDINGENSKSSIIMCNGSGKLNILGKSENTGIKIDSEKSKSFSPIITQDSCKVNLEGQIGIYGKDFGISSSHKSTINLNGSNKIIVKGNLNYGLYLEEDTEVNISGNVNIEGAEMAIKFNDKNPKVNILSKYLHLKGNEFNTYLKFENEDNVFISPSYVDKCKLKHSMAFTDGYGNKIPIQFDCKYLDPEKYEHHRYHESGKISESNQAALHTFYDNNSNKFVLIVFHKGTNINSPIKLLSTEELKGFEVQRNFSLVTKISPSELNLKDSSDKKDIDVTIYYDTEIDNIIEIQIIQIELNKIYTTIKSDSFVKKDVNNKSITIKIPINKSTFLGAYDFKSISKDEKVLSYVCKKCSFKVYDLLEIESISLNKIKYTKDLGKIYFNKNKFLDKIEINYKKNILDRKRFKISNNKNATLETGLSQTNRKQFIIYTKNLIKKLNGSSINITIEDTCMKINTTLNIKFVELLSISENDIYLDKNDSDIILVYNHKLRNFNGIDIVKKSNKKVVKSFSKNDVRYNLNIKSYIINVKASDINYSGKYLFKTKFENKDLNFIQEDVEIMIHKKSGNFNFKTMLLIVIPIIIILLIAFLIIKCKKSKKSDVIESIASDKKEISLGLTDKFVS